jgi:hypothetical protein
VGISLWSLTVEYRWRISLRGFTSRSPNPAATLLHRTANEEHPATEVSMIRVSIYTTPFCPYCRSAKALLRTLGRGVLSKLPGRALPNTPQRNSGVPG